MRNPSIFLFVTILAVRRTVLPCGAAATVVCHQEGQVPKHPGSAPQAEPTKCRDRTLCLQGPCPKVGDRVPKWGHRLTDEGLGKTALSKAHPLLSADAQVTEDSRSLIFPEEGTQMCDHTSPASSFPTTDSSHTTHEPRSLRPRDGKCWGWGLQVGESEGQFSPSGL